MFLDSKGKGREKPVLRNYRHLPIKGDGLIRLLKLFSANKPGMENSPSTAIECEIIEVALESSHCHEGLSYAWGLPERNIPIWVRGHSSEVRAEDEPFSGALYITGNLLAALKRLPTIKRLSSALD
jgi:hypothetical protein